MSKQTVLCQPTRGCFTSITHHSCSFPYPIWYRFVAHCMTQITVTTQNHAQVLTRALFAKISLFSFQECSCKQKFAWINTNRKQSKIQGLLGVGFLFVGGGGNCRGLPAFILAEKKLQCFPVSAMHVFISYIN